ncbi:MAG: DUF3592 domain-containing protein [Clostridiales bacterium]|nr:DUF3592 domain-containing protein [Clostridiales bacterium]
MSDKFYLIVGIIFLIFGIGGIGAAISNKVSCTENVTATISNVKIKRYNIRFHLLVTYSPVFTYTFDGKKYTVNADLSTLRSKKYEKGNEFAIKVNPKDPKEIYAGSNLSLTLFGIFCAVAGITMIICFFL